MERVVVHLASGLCRRNIETMVVCIENPGELAPFLESTGVQLQAVASVRSMDIGAVWRLGRLFRSFAPSVINIHDYASSPYAVSANWMAGRAPILFTAHGLLYEGFDQLRNRYRFFSKGFSRLTAVSDEVASRHKEFLNWSDSVRIISNGVPAIEPDRDRRNKVRRELGCRDVDYLFLAVGNPRPEKGFEDLIDATQILNNNNTSDKNLLVAVAGKMTDTPYCRMLKKQTKQRGVEDHCRFIGFRSNMDALYAAADAFVLSSRSEGLPMVVLESMMAGLPVIATRVGGVPDAVGEHGLLVDPGQPAQIADAMARLMTEEGLAGRLGKSGKAHAHRVYGVDRMVDEYIACYRGMVNGKGRR
jgi:glycosyltransferase involved in cell wall biosynthesis